MARHFAENGGAPACGGAEKRARCGAVAAQQWCPFLPYCEARSPAEPRSLTAPGTLPRRPRPRTQLILRKAQPKRLGAFTLTGPALAGLTEAYVAAINGGAVPTIATAWQVRRARARRDRGCGPTSEGGQCRSHHGLGAMAALAPLYLEVTNVGHVACLHSRFVAQSRLLPLSTQGVAEQECRRAADAAEAA